MSGECLIVRADASVQIGTGHVMRCLALAQAWQDARGRVTFAMRESTPALNARLRAEQCEVVELGGDVGTLEDAENTAAIAQERGAQWVVVDGYGFGAEYQRSLKERGFRVLYIDDNGDAGRYFADLVLNQNLHATEGLYRDRDVNTRLLLGTRFALLRREFRSWKGWTRTVPDHAQRILITMGGSDPDNVTALVLEAVMSFSDVEVDVVVGGSNPHREMLREAATRCRGRITLHENVNDMPRLLAGVDFAVSGAGTTTLEMCLLGLPALLVVLADNQQLVAEELSRGGAAVNLGAGCTLNVSSLRQRLTEILKSQEFRKTMAAAGQRLVDGQGASRVIRALRVFNLVLRRASEQDCRLLWEMVNDPSVRASAFSQSAIPFDRHALWFEEKLGSGRCHIFIGESDGAAVGQVRFDEREDGEADTDVSVVPEVRGAGFGSQLIGAAVREVFATTHIRRIHAFIRPENGPSRRAFEAAGFRTVGVTDTTGRYAVHYLREFDEASSQVGGVRE